MTVKEWFKRHPIIPKYDLEAQNMKLVETLASTYSQTHKKLELSDMMALHDLVATVPSESNKTECQYCRTKKGFENGACKSCGAPEP